VTRLGEEYVVVDEVTQSAHALRGSTARAWAALEAGQVLDTSDEELGQALAELRSLGLLADGSAPREWTRRDVLERAGVVAFAGTVITIGLPSVHAAASAPLPQATTATLSGPDTATTSGGIALSLSVLGSNGPAEGTASLFEIINNSNQAVVNNSSQTVTGGVASFSVLAPTVGEHSYVAVYNGDAVKYSGGKTSNPKVVNVTGLQPKVDPTVGLTGMNTELAKAYTVTVTVSGSSGTPGGNVTLSATGGATVTGPAMKGLSNGTQTWTVTNPSTAGSNIVLTAAYAGNTTYNSKDGTASYATTKIVIPPSAITITQTNTNANLASNKKNASTTVSVLVGGASGFIPSGSVKLTASANVTITGSDTRNLDPATGRTTTSFTVTNPSADNTPYTLTASYSGDDRFLTANANRPDTTS
jgi:hypothetical protein